MRIVCPSPNAIGKTTGRIGPVSFTQSSSLPQFPTIAERNLELYHALWNEMHTQEDPSTDWFQDWCSRVPEASCGCQRWLSEYVLNNHPRFDDWPRYSWEMHKAVSAKVHPSRELFSWEEFLAMYRKD